MCPPHPAPLTPPKTHPSPRVDKEEPWSTARSANLFWPLRSSFIYLERRSQFSALLFTTLDGSCLFFFLFSFSLRLGVIIHVFGEGGTTTCCVYMRLKQSRFIS